MDDLLHDIICDLDINIDKNSIKEKEILKKLVRKVLLIASDWTNREPTDEKLIPYVSDCIKAMWLKRGDEDKESMSEGGESYVYRNAIKDMKKDLVSIRILK